MSNITVSYAEIEQSAAQLGAGRDELQAQLQALQQTIQQLVSSGFVTEQASVRFGEAFTEFTTSASATVGGLSEIQNYLVQSSRALRDMDAQLAARIQ